MDYNNMTWSEMINYIKNNPNRKVTHELFAPGEYIYCDGFKVYTEEGYLFEDFISAGIDRFDGLRSRCDGNWSTGWSAIKE